MFMFDNKKIKNNIELNITECAENKNWSKISLSITDFLKKNNLNNKNITEILIVCEEIFVNICKYSYINLNYIGDVNINIKYNFNDLEIKFVDSGVKFDPTLVCTPDINKSAKDRKIGGLGLYIVKKIVDNIQYKFIDNKNILILNKKINN